MNNPQIDRDKKPDVSIPDQKWFDVIHTPVGPTAGWIERRALTTERRAHQETHERMMEALSEAESIRKMLAVLIPKSGGKVTITQGELDSVDVNAEIRSEYDASKRESTFWVVSDV